MIFCKRLSKPGIRRLRGGHNLVPLNFVDPFPILKDYLKTCLVDKNKDKLKVLLLVDNLVIKQDENEKWLNRFITYFIVKQERFENMYNKTFLDSEFLRANFSKDGDNFSCLYSGFSRHLNDTGRSFNVNDFNDYLHNVFFKWNSERNSSK